MSIGLEEAARRHKRALEVPLAIDIDGDVIGLYHSNLPYSTTLTVDVTTLLNGQIGAPPTPGETVLQKTVGQVDVLLGGPPCQGHSDLNNHTRRKDPKNDLYLVMARAAEVLAPKVVVVENVATVVHDEGEVVDVTRKALSTMGYRVAGRVLDLRRLGVPQRRRRYLLLASKLGEIDPAVVLERLANDNQHADRTVRWAIEDLVDSPETSRFDTASRPSPESVKRMAHLFDNDLYDLPNSERPKCHRDFEHTYVSMYGRLRWDEPAQTITTGFGSMGQGRYVHPSRRRTITPHEAARLQTFPDWFDFGSDTERGVLARMIGNAVPPLLMVALGTDIVRGLGEAAERQASPRE